MNNAPEDKKWVICPRCHEPNAAGREFCQKCWSPKLKSLKPLNTAEMEEAIDQWKAQQKRRRHVKILVIASAILTVIIAITFFIFYTSTDIFFKPDITLSSNSTADNWAMFRQNQWRTGMAGPTEQLPAGTVLWTFAAGGAIHSSPAIVNGTVYFGSTDHKFYALDAATGNEKWKFETGSWVESSPAVVDGVVYFGSNDGYLYALNAENGDKIWSFKTKYAIRSSPAISGDVVYFGSDDGFLYALKSKTGKQLWRYKTRGLVQGSPVVANGIVYVCAGNALYTLDAYSGRFRMHFETYYNSDSSPAIEGTTVYFGNSDGILYAVSGNARSWPWEFDIRKWWINFWLWGLAPAPPPQSGSLWGIDVGDGVRSSPAIANDMIYIGVGNDLIAVNTQSHKIIWSFNTGGLAVSSPVVAGNTVFCGSKDGNIYAVSATSGQQLWKIETGGPVESSAALVNGILYVGSDDGKLYAIK